MSGVPEDAQVAQGVEERRCGYCGSPGHDGRSKKCPAKQPTLEAMVLTLNSTSSHRFNQATKSLSDSKDFNETITAEHLRQLRAPRPDLVGSSLLHMLFDVGARHAQQAGSLIRQLFAKSKDLTANPLTRPDKNGKTSLEKCCTDALIGECIASTEFREALYAILSSNDHARLQDHFYASIMPGAWTLTNCQLHHKQLFELIFARSRGHEELVPALFSLWPSYTARKKALTTEHTDAVADILLRRCPSLTERHNGETLLELAIKTGWAELAGSLLQRMPLLAKEGEPVLHLRRRIEDASLSSFLHMLTDHGADFSVEDASNRSIIHLFLVECAGRWLVVDEARAAMASAFRALVAAAKSKVSDGDNKGNTPLHLLHLFNSKVIVDGCRQAGLHSLAFNDFLPTLLEYGANAQATNYDSATFIDLIKEDLRPIIVDKFRELNQGLPPVTLGGETEGTQKSEGPTDDDTEADDPGVLSGSEMEVGDAGEDVADDAVATDVMEAVAQAEERLSLSPTDMDIEVTEVPDGREVQLTLHDLGEKWAALQKELQEAQRRDRKTRLDLKRAREDAEALAKELAKERKLKQAREEAVKDLTQQLKTVGRLSKNALGTVLAGVPDKDLVWGEQLGKGSYGVVRRAAYGGMSFAVKELNPGAAAIKEVEAFKSLCARMEEPHPNIVHVLYIKQATTVSPKRGVCIFMELANGTLDDYLRKRLEEQANLGHAGTRNALLPQNDVLHFLTGILEGLVYMHKNEVAHRDLKAKNILHFERAEGLPTLKLADFGSAKLLAGAAFSHSHTCNGTGGYMALEVVQNTGGKYDAFAADMFSFSRVCEYVLSLAPPESKADRSPIPMKANFKKLIKKTYLRALLTFVGKCGHREPGKRHTAVQALDIVKNRL